MKQILIGTILFLLVFESTKAADSVVQKTTRVNFFISVRIKKIDPAMTSAQLQAILVNQLQMGKLYCLFVGSAEELADRVSAILKKRNAMIGTIWFDSHGHFNRRRSLFDIGKDEFNAVSIQDTVLTAPLTRLAQYCDTNTNVGIGSCYGGATYKVPAVENFPEQEMNGNLLMMHLSCLLNHARVFGSESFVMTGPGIFAASYKLAGYPRRKKFKDPIYEPVWHYLGEWNCYNGNTGEFYRVPTVTINQQGNLYCKKRGYLSYARNRKTLQKKLARFKKGNYNIAAFYQE